MLANLVINADLVDWIVAVLALGALLVSLVALWQTSRSNAIARDANELARHANTLAERTTKVQEDEAKVKLVVKPRMMVAAGEGGNARPFVEIINLSSFPVTISAIWWRMIDDKWGFWKNPDISSPYGSLPARLPSHESLTAMGSPDFPTREQLLATTAAVAFTACGEKIVGMTDEWLKYAEKVRSGELGATPGDTGVSPV